MDYNVKQLLEKYWAGESSLEEEQTLRNYFQQHTIDPDLEKYRSLFQYFGDQQTISMKGTIETEQLETKAKSKTTSIKRRLMIWRVAAAVALLIGLFSVYNKINTTPPKAIVWVDTYDNEEDALRKTKEVLLLVSRKMKKGTDKAAFSLAKAQVATGVVKD